jgi:plastocyanin
MRGRALALALAGSRGLLSACGGPGGNKAGAALKASPGSSLPGMPGGSGTAPSSMAGMAMPSPSAAGAARPIAGNRVAIKGFAFAPAALTVPVGTTVTWTNQDSDAHTVTSDGGGGPLNSKALATGDTFSFTFTQAGTFKYLCTIHPFMTATVTVTR